MDRVKDSVRSALPPMPPSDNGSVSGSGSSSGDGMKYLAAAVILGGVVGNMFAAKRLRAMRGVKPPQGPGPSTFLPASPVPNLCLLLLLSFSFIFLLFRSLYDLRALLHAMSTDLIPPPPDAPWQAPSPSNHYYNEHITEKNYTANIGRPFPSSQDFMPHGGSHAHAHGRSFGSDSSAAFDTELKFVSDYRAWRKEGHPAAVSSSAYSRPKFSTTSSTGVGGTPMSSGTYVRNVICNM